MTRRFGLSIVLAVAAFACNADKDGDDTTDETSDSETDTMMEESESESEVAVPDMCTEDGTLCLDLVVPSDYAGDPREVFLGLYAALPVFGPPDLSLPAQSIDEVTAGSTLELIWTEDVPTSGDYFAYAVLYDTAGGTFQPTEGVDYAAVTDSTHTFDGSAVNLTLELALAESLTD